MMKVLVIGSGGREDAIAWIAQWAECVPIAATDIDGLLAFAEQNGIDLTVVGPEVPLIAGIVDVFEQRGQRIFGPAREPALIEGSKSYAKDLMRRHGIPTAEYEVFQHADAASKYATDHFLSSPETPIVIKADGEAAGKGVFICHQVAEAEEAIRKIMVQKVFGASGDTLIIEEFLVGQEASLMAFTDGTTIVPMVPAQDHKRALDGDLGPNTGGMGCYAPVPMITPSVYAQAVDQVLRPAVEAIRSTGIPYKGVLYAGVIVSPTGQIKTLEFNCRFGDPETQTVLPLLETDLLEILLGVTEANLDEVSISWKPKHSVCVTLASGGYPGAYATGLPIEGLEQVAHLSDVTVFHAGTQLAEDGRVLTDGGRVLSVDALGDDFQQARARAYAAIKNIHYDHMHFRTDIAQRAIDSEVES